jgi:NAD(P)H-hydrate epimerase
MMQPPAPFQLLSVAEMDAADRGAVEAGVPEARLMEAAGAAVASVARTLLPKRGRVRVLCGPGNNGGDGYVAARLLAEAHDVRVETLGRPRGGGAAAAAAEAWRGATAALAEEPREADLVIDALFGAGLARPLDALAAAAVRRLNEARTPVLAVDLPSGVAGDSGEALGGLAVRAAHTVTFCRRKPGHLLQPGRSLCGPVTVADIGIPEPVVEGLAPTLMEAGGWLLPLLPRRRWDSHKYALGYVLIRGGATMTGAGRLAARAALRCGAGLVAVSASAAALPVYATAADSLILLPEPWESLLQDERRNALLIGPGNGLGKETRQAAEAALATGRATVLDADALGVFAGAADELASRIRGPVVLTPHEGEFGRLFPKLAPGLAGSKLERARRAAERLGAVVLLKGHDSVIAAPDGRAAINASAPPALAIAGAGDVLSGMVVALLAQGLPAFEAAALAAWLHGLAARGAGRGLIADDLPDRLPALFARLESPDADS